MLRICPTSEQQTLSADLQIHAKAGGVTDLPADVRALVSIIAASNGAFEDMTDACLRSLYGILQNIDLAARKRIGE